MAVLTALLLSVLSRAKAKAQRPVCINNLRQINLGIRMYSDDSHDAPPSPGLESSSDVLNLYSGYKALMKSYVGLNGASSAQDKLFACPADLFYPNWIFTNNPAAGRQYLHESLHDQPFLDYSSYVF